MLLRRSVKQVLLISLFFGFLLSRGLYSQDSISEVNDYKNSIKFFTIGTPPLIFPFIYSVTGGYERFIDHTNAFELVGSYFFNEDEMGSETKIVTIHPGYNHYFKVKKHKGPYFRIGGFFKYSHHFLNHWGSSGERYGAGVIAGLRVNVSKNHRFTFDFAWRISYDYIIGKHEYLLDRNIRGWYPNVRPVIHFTTRF